MNDFATIDIRLINCFQWALRQCELFTNLDRKKLLNISMSVYKIALTILSLITVSRFMFRVNVVGVFTNIVFLLLSILIYLNWLILIGKRTKSEALPEEIATRKKHRLLILIGHTPLAFVFLSSALVLTLSQTGDIAEELMTFDHLFFSILLFLHFPTEYLLCTTSLPPGEKERRKAEKEQRNMTLVGIKN